MNKGSNYLIYSIYYKFIVTALVVALSISYSLAQNADNYTFLKNKFEGTWRNKESKRSISISFETEVDYVTINDWTGKYNNKYAEAYKAYIKDDKLILYAEDVDHHAAYCELDVANKMLMYQCNEGLNFKDQFLNTNNGTSRSVYQKLR